MCRSYQTACVNSSALVSATSPEFVRTIKILICREILLPALESIQSLYTLLSHRNVLCTDVSTSLRLARWNSDA